MRLSFALSHSLEESPRSPWTAGPLESSRASNKHEGHGRRSQLGRCKQRASFVRRRHAILFVVLVGGFARDGSDAASRCLMGLRPQENAQAERASERVRFLHDKKGSATRKVTGASGAGITARRPR